MIAAILTVPVLLYQLLFVVIMYLASRVGPKTMVVALVASLAWTVTHLFFPPLAVFQSLVIVGSYLWFRHNRKPGPSAAPALLPKPQDTTPAERERD
ncbi:hypothetical protein [Lysobacter sp. CA199]|uniref:hypothetical protein n=1 Tax=Lysobacter sp. CA199 TaxID=3455608 RepID=UPI003F8D74B2